MSARYVLAAFGVLAAAPAASAETLDDAIARALAGDPSLASARSDLEAARADVRAARAEFLPSLSASVSYSASRDESDAQSSVDTDGDGIPDTVFSEAGSYTTESGSAGLDVSQTVYTGGRVSANLAAAKAEEARVRATVQALEDDLVLTVVGAYASILYGEQEVVIRRQEVERLAQEVEAGIVRFEVGASTRTDLYTAEAELADGRSALATAQADLASVRATYRRRVGAAPGTLERPAPPTVPALEQALDAARQRSPDVQAAAAAADAARARRRAAASDYWPTVSLSAGATRRGEDGFDNFDRDSSSFSASLSIPLWTGGRTSAALAGARASERGARYDLDDAVRAVEEETTQAWADLEAALRRRDTSATQLESASFATRGAELERREGLRTQLELLTQIQSERDAALAVAQAERDVLTASYTVLVAIGAAPRAGAAPR